MKKQIGKKLTLNKKNVAELTNTTSDKVKGGTGCGGGTGGYNCWVTTVTKPIKYTCYW